jgi:hypothetical protein
MEHYYSCQLNLF